MKSKNIGYIPEVDHIRGIAAVWIVFYHGEQLLEALIRTGKNFTGEWHYTLNPFAALIREGHTAVALFMVLSGFIFTYGSYGKDIQYLRFMGNRLLRIYPLFLCLVFLSIATAPQNFSMGAFFSTVLPFANVHTLPSPLLSMAWAIAVEFQFYLIFPFLLRFLNNGPFKFALAVIGCALTFRLLSVGLGGSARDISYWHIAGRIDQFILGMLAAALLHNMALHRRPLLMRRVFYALVPMVILMLFGFHRLGGWPVDPAWKVVWPTIEGLAYAALIPAYIASQIVLPKPVSSALAGVGKVSFSVYLLHFPILMILVSHGIVWTPTGNSSVDAVISTLCILLPLTLAVSSLTYLTIERPFLGLRRRYIKDIQAASPTPRQSVQAHGTTEHGTSVAYNDTQPSLTARRPATHAGTNH